MTPLNYEGQYTLVLSGPSASGKSTVSRELWGLLPQRPALIVLDDLKHLFHEDASTDYYLDLAAENGLLLTRNILCRGHSVIVEKAFGSYEFVEPFIRCSISFEVPVYYFKLCASLEMLLERNRGRERKLSEEKVVRNFEFYRAHEHSQGITIDTEKFTPEEVVAFIRDAILGRRAT